MSDLIRGSAVVTPDGRYRWRLSRDTEFMFGEGRVCWIMLNPSTADATTDDPTIRRVRGFTTRLGHRWLDVVNLFAYRATDPAELWAAHRDGIDIEGDHNIAAIIEAVLDSDLVVCAWGANADANSSAVGHRQATRVLRILDALRVIPHCLGPLTKGGEPRHPLYLPTDAPLNPFEPG